MFTFSDGSRQVYVQGVSGQRASFSLERRGDAVGQRDPDDVRADETVDGVLHERRQGALFVHGVQSGHQFGLVERRPHVPLDPDHRQQVTQHAES